MRVQVYNHFQQNIRLLNQVLRPQEHRVIEIPGPSVIVEGFMLDEQGKRVWKKLATYNFEVPITSLHLGQVTTRIMSTEWNNPVNPVVTNQGMPYVYFHNMTDLPLYLNENIRIPPHTRLQYLGRYHIGVHLGMVLADRNGLFPRVWLKRPITDLYYGLPTTNEQPLFGGWQTELNEDATEPTYLSQDGYFS
jgi:hypothetical protein